MNKEHLCTELSKDNQEALKQLFRDFLKPLLFFANKLLSDQYEAEDIVLDTMNKLWSKRTTFTSYDHIQSFLYLTVRHSCIDHFRKQQRTAVVHKALSHTSPDGICATNLEEQLHLKMMDAELMMRFQSVVDTLPEQCRYVMDLSYDGYSNMEIAETLKTSINTVEVQKNRGIGKLRIEVAKAKLLRPAYLGSAAWVVLLNL
jgi:RNA polymerase sigma-70 factor (family 1)